MAAVLPASRSVQVGDAATAFATIISIGGETARNCTIAPPPGLAADFTFQTTDPATNEITGSPDTPVDIPAGQAQSFVIALTPTAPIAPTDVNLIFGCTNTAPATTVTGLNTLLLSASTEPSPDIIALVATISGNGIVDIPGTTGIGVFAVATVNVGVDGTIMASADTGSADIPVAISICETEPATGLCLAPPVAAATGVITQIDAGETPTFGVFVTGTGNVPFDPATNRIFVRFFASAVLPDPSPVGVVRGATSVAVQTQ